MDNCHCIRGEGNYLFEIKYFTKDSFLYQDLSNWNTDGKYSVPESYTVIITPPNVEKSYSINVNTRCFTKISNEDLEGNLKDGIYCIKFKNCDYIYKGYFAITNKMDCCLEKMIVNDEKEWKELDGMLKKVKIATKLGDFDLAKKLMKVANDFGYINNCNC